MVSVHIFPTGFNSTPLCRMTDKPEHSLPQWASNPDMVCPGVMPAFHTHTSYPTVSKSWGAGITSPSFAHLEGIHVVLTGHQKEAGSSLETLVPSSGICLRQSQSITLATPVKWAKCNLHQISLLEKAKGQVCKSWLSHWSKKTSCLLHRFNQLFNKKRVLWSWVLLQLSWKVIAAWTSVQDKWVGM